MRRTEHEGRSAHGAWPHTSSPGRAVWRAPLDPVASSSMLGFLACRISFAWGGRGGATVSSSSGNCGMADRMRTSARVGAKSVRTEGAARAWKMIGRRSAFWLALDCGRALFDEFFHNLTFFPKWFVKCERLSCFWLVSRDGCNELFRQHRFEKILDWGIRSRRSRPLVPFSV